MVYLFGEVKSIKLLHYDLLHCKKKGIRTITKSGYVAHTDPLFKELGLLKLTDMYKLQVIKMYCLALEKRTPDYICSKVDSTYIKHNYNTRTG